MSESTGDDRFLEAFEDPESEAARKMFSHPLLQGYWQSERIAILRFGCRLSRQGEGTISVKETVQAWEKSACFSWRREKMRLDGQRQLEEIERHKFLVSQQLGYDIGWEQAAMDWIERHASEWRRWWEKQPEACPSREPESCPNLEP